jgi:hypothetical protein
MSDFWKTLFRAFATKLIEIEIEIEIVYNMYRMRQFTIITVCAG